MNRQEVFDKVAKHLLTQNAQSVNGKSCAYRGWDGLKCAIGALITDEALDGLSIEGAPADAGRVVDALRASGYDVVPSDHSFLLDLQAIHDEVPVDQWREALKALAAELDLSAAVLS